MGGMSGGENRNAYGFYGFGWFQEHSPFEESSVSSQWGCETRAGFTGSIASATADLTHKTAA